MFLGFLLNLSNKSSRSSKNSFSKQTYSFAKQTYKFEYFQAKATVVSPIRGSEEGRIKLHGIFWFAKIANPAAVSSVERDALVTIVGRELNTLIVQPYSRKLE